MRAAVGAAIPHAGEYSPSRNAGCCPGCGEWVKAYDVKPWAGNVRLRYHRCACGERFKTPQVDPTAGLLPYMVTTA